MSLGPVHRVVHVEAAAGRLFEHPGDEDVSELWVAYHSAADAYAYLGVPQMHLPRGRGGFEGEHVNRMIKPSYRYERRPWFPAMRRAGWSAIWASTPAR